MNQLTQNQTVLCDQIQELVEMCSQEREQVKVCREEIGKLERLREVIHRWIHVNTRSRNVPWSTRFKVYERTK